MSRLPLRRTRIYPQGVSRGGATAPRHYRLTGNPHVIEGLGFHRSGVIRCFVPHRVYVIPAKAGIQFESTTSAKDCRMDSRFRGNDAGVLRYAVSNDATTRMPMSLVLGYLAAGQSADQIVAEFPDLTRDQIAACLDYARRPLTSKGSWPFKS